MPTPVPTLKIFQSRANNNLLSTESVAVDHVTGDCYIIGANR